jgi:hypothetical protein
MSLFVGNISKFLSLRDLERQFGVYGKCKVDLRVIRYIPKSNRGSMHS